MVAPIREYERQFGARAADPGRRATPEDMGIAGGIQDLAQGVGYAANVMQRHEENSELADAQIKMAEADAMWDEKRRQLHAEAKPGVSTAKKIKEDMTGYFTQFAGNYKTEAARKYVQLHGTRLTTQNVNQSAVFDVDLAVKDKFNKIDGIFDSAQKLAYSDPSQYQAKRDAILFDAKNRIGVFDMPGDARVQIALDKEIQRRVEGVALMAAQGDIRNPSVRGMIVGSIPKTFQGGTGMSFDDVFGRLIQTESGGVHSKNGSLTTSEKGALGITQVMPKTGRDPGYGVTPLQNDSQEEYVRFGRDYLQAMQKEFNGDMTMALAAYNAGPGAVKAAIKLNGDNWLSGMPQETQKYVQKIGVVTSEPAVVDAPPDLKQKPAWWDDLTAEKQISITNAARELDRREKSVADAALKNTIKDIDAYISMNGKLPPNLPTAAAFTDPVEYQKFTAMVEAGRKIETVTDAPVAQQEALLASMKPEYGKDAPGVFDYKEKVYREAERLIKATNEHRVKDQVGAAYSRNFSSASPIKPIENFDADNLVGELSKRFPQADAIAKNAGLGFKPLMNSEAAALNKQINSMTPDQLAPWIDKLVNGVSDKNSLRAVFRQIAPNDKAFSIATDIALSNEVPIAKSDADMNAILFGRSVMAPIKGQGTEQEKAYKNAMLPSSGDAIKQISKFAGQLNMPEGQLQALAEAVTAHYIGSSLSKNSNKNLDLTDKEVGSKNVDAFNQSIVAIMGDKNGGTVGTKTGSTVVLRPYGMDDGTFRNRVQEQIDIAYNGKYQWGEYSLQTTPDGKYQAFIAGKEPIIIDPLSSPYRREGARQEQVLTAQEKKVKEYKDRGFFGNLGAAFTGGNMGGK